jgi:hypothetical protein
LPDGVPAGNYSFSFTAMAGEGDMNMTELVAINAAFDNTATRHRIMLFPGKHEWAPVGIMNKALAGFLFDAMYHKLIPVDEKLINSYITAGKKLVNESAPLKAVEQCTFVINTLKGVTDVSWFEKKKAEITGSEVYKQQLQARQQLLQTEQQKKALYMRQFEEGDLNYWMKTINELNIKAKAATAEGAMHQRLLAYLSLAFYSISNQQVRSNHNDVAQHFVNLYKLADPANSEAWYFSAILHARRNEKDLAEKDLQKAESLGFTDTVRLKEVRKLFSY